MCQQKYHISCLKFACFSKAMIERIHYRLNLVVSYILKTQVPPL